MQTIYGTSEDRKGQLIGYFIHQKMGKPVCPPYSAIGWLNNKDSLIGAALFNDYNGANVEVTIYGPGAMTRQSMAEGFRYVFNQLKCTRLTAKVQRNNKLMRRLIGDPSKGRASYESTMTRYFGPHRSDDALVYRIDPKHAEKWIR